MSFYNALILPFVHSVDMLKQIKVDLSHIKPDSVSIRGFDNISKKTLGTITLPIKVGLFILNSHIHVAHGPLNYNLLLGRPWLHAMNVVPSNLHQKITFIYNNMICTLHVDTKTSSCLNFEEEKNQESFDDPPSTSTLLGDD